MSIPHPALFLGETALILDRGPHLQGIPSPYHEKWYLGPQKPVHQPHRSGQNGRCRSKMFPSAWISRLVLKITIALLHSCWMWKNWLPALLANNLGTGRHSLSKNGVTTQKAEPRKGERETSSSKITESCRSSWAKKQICYLKLIMTAFLYFSFWILVFCLNQKHCKYC